MSMYVTLDTWYQLIEQLEKTDDPQCFAVNYLPDEEKYALWIGNQPYSNYEEMLERQDIKTDSLIKDRNDLRKQVAELKHQLETYAGAESQQENQKEAPASTIPINSSEVIRGMIFDEMQRMLENLSLKVSVSVDEKK